MELLGIVSFGIILLSMLFSIFLLLRPRHEEMFGLEKKWVAFGGIMVLFLATFLFYIAGFQANDVVQNYTIGGVKKTLTLNTMDLPGQTYYQFVNFATYFSFLFYIVCIIREASLLGAIRQNKRTNRS